MLNNICPKYIINNQVTSALIEDSLTFPDYTAALVNNVITTATIITRQNMTLCGTEWVNQAFLNCDKNANISWAYKDGDKITAGSLLCEITANAREMLTAERTALNFLQLLSATATITSQYVEKTRVYNTKIMDTRKTIPGLRLSQKYAVVVGGGFNQRIGLYDGVLIKENHITGCGGISNALNKAFKDTPPHIPIQIEVETFEQLVEAMNSDAKLILLDNMTTSQIKKCVDYVKDKAQLEASGNINLDNVLDYAQTGVHRISIGSLTKNIAAIDLSMRISLK
ncbi:MAG: carboxylating nicotinate-nucleotide diphosphorylase [Neisseriaceae bacterium]